MPSQASRLFATTLKIRGRFRDSYAELKIRHLSRSMPCNWGHKRIGEIIIRNKVNKVGRNIDLKPATTDELFAAAVGSSVAKGETNIVVDDCMEKDKKAIIEPKNPDVDDYVERLKQALIRNGGRVIDSKKYLNTVPIARQKPKKDSVAHGLFARAKAWLKGDKGYKK